MPNTKPLLEQPKIILGVLILIALGCVIALFQYFIIPILWIILILSILSISNAIRVIIKYEREKDNKE